MKVHETFNATVQGEGYWAGTLCDFIRLYGCGVGCPWCDTGYSPEDGYGRSIVPVDMTVEQLVAGTASHHVVISGGEPMNHRTLPDLVKGLLDAGKVPHIETSGAHWQIVDPAAWITLSPKAHVSPNGQVDPRFWSRANEVKIVISDGTELDYYRNWLEGIKAPLFLQPEWTERGQTIGLTIDLLKQNPNARLSAQQHKYLEVQ